MSSLISLLLVWAGVAVTAFTAVRLVLARDVLMRLHFVGPATVVAAPLLVAGIAVAPGTWSSPHDMLKLAVIGLLLAGTGPAAVVTVARAAQRERPDV